MRDTTKRPAGRPSQQDDGGFPLEIFPHLRGSRPNAAAMYGRSRAYGVGLRPGADRRQMASNMSVRQDDAGRPMQWGARLHLRGRLLLAVVAPLRTRSPAAAVGPSLSVPVTPPPAPRRPRRGPTLLAAAAAVALAGGLLLLFALAGGRGNDGVPAFVAA